MHQNNCIFILADYNFQIFRNHKHKFECTDHKYFENVENISKMVLTKVVLSDTIYLQDKNGGALMGKGQETKRDKFVRLAEARTNKIIDMIQLLGNCSNLGAYDYTQQDVDKIFTAIENELREAKKKFSKVDSKKGTRFSLD